MVINPEDIKSLIKFFLYLKKEKNMKHQKNLNDSVCGFKRNFQFSNYINRLRIAEQFFVVLILLFLFHFSIYQINVALE